LIGVAAYPDGLYDSTDPHDDDTYLYIPSISTGKYYKVRAGLVSAGYSGSTDEMTEAVLAYANSTANKDGRWNDIPFATDADLGGSVSYDWDQSPLTEASDQILYNKYKGDICKFLSDNKEASKLTRSWVMPKSEIWKGRESGQNYKEDIDGVYRYEKNAWNGSGSFSPSDENGTGSTDIAFITYINKATGETAAFPVAGLRRDGQLYYVGVTSRYWSSSVSTASSAYGLGIYESFVNPGVSYNRTYFFSVRCVQEF
jgi:hypothetical protein